jgi:hypothetical protein
MNTGGSIAFRALPKTRFSSFGFYGG